MKENSKYKNSIYENRSSTDLTDEEIEERLRAMPIVGVIGTIFLIVMFCTDAMAEHWIISLIIAFFVLKQFISSK